MKLHQLSLFLENKPKQLRVPSKALAEAGIDILTMSLADTQQFGILRLITQQWSRAREVLEKAGCVVNVTEVLAVEVPDQPGGLDAFLQFVEDSDLNIEYMYSFSFQRNNKAVLVIRFEETDAAIKAFENSGMNVVQSVDLYKQAES
jgi:hypothetical protein